MARATITPVALTKTGLNLTDQAVTTMSTGAGNGVQFTFNVEHIVVLLNDTGGAAVYTFKVPTDQDLSDKGITTDDVTVTVATAKTWLYPLSKIFKQSDGKVYIDCDVAGKIVVLDPPE